MNLTEFNNLGKKRVQAELLRCCGSQRWVEILEERRPFKDFDHLQHEAAEVWNRLDPQDWLEAFGAHPKIGDLESLRHRFKDTRNWSEGEQSGVEGASEDTLRGLAEGNRHYEERFGHLFLVCATGKSAREMLEILHQRLANEPEKELLVAVGEQEKITRLRLAKLLDIGDTSP